MWKPAGPVFRARTHAGAAHHEGRLHVVSGWNGVSAGGRNFADSWRSSDLIVAEKSTGTPPYPVAFTYLASFDGKLILGPGYNGSFPPKAPDDQVSDFFQVSKDGGGSWTPVFAPGMTPHETGRLVECGGYLYDFGGLYYDWKRKPNYAMNHQVWRFEAGQDAPVLVNDYLPWSRRSFGACAWDGAILTYGGADDSVSSAMFSDVWTSSDGLKTMTKIADGSRPGSLIGCSLVDFHVKGSPRLCLVGGRWSGGFTAAVWSTETPEDPASWVRHADLPSPRQGMQVVRMPVNGVDCLVAVGGQNNGGTGAVNEIILSSDLDAGWSVLVSSDFMAA